MRHALLSAFVLLFAACGGETVPALPGPSVETPTLLSLNADQASVGDDISFYGGGFLNKGGHVQLTFSGTYDTYGNGSWPVSMTIRPDWTSGNQIDWTTFGPFFIPFGDGSSLGSFIGTITATNVNDTTGETSASKPLSVTLRVTPSIIVTSFQPVTATKCPSPVERILGGYPYVITVKAVGFTPVNFSYYQVSPDFIPPPLRHPANGQVDTFGLNNELFFPPVPAGQAFYVSEFVISSLATDGNTYGVTFNYGVHRPIEYLPTGPALVAEYEAPQPVGSCIPGNQFGGETVTYSDTETQDKTRNVGYSWNQSWQETQQETDTTGTTVTNGTNLSVSTGNNVSWTAGWNVGETDSTTDTSGWSQNYGSSSNNGNGTNSMTGSSSTDTTGVSFNPSILGIGGGVEGGTSDTSSSSTGSSTETSVGQNYNTGSENSVQSSMSDTVGQNGSTTMGQSQQTTVGANHSESDTESWAFSNSNGYTVTSGNSGFWQISSSSAINFSTQGTINPGYDGWWYRQTTRLAYPGEVITYDLCSEPTVAATAYFYDYEWAVALALGQGCSPNNMPIPSSFPAAKCYIGCD